MSDRTAELRRVAADLRDHEAVDDAFLAKSFSDRLLIVDVGDDRVPTGVANRLAAHDLHAADGVYGDDEGNSFVGAVGDATWHHFVDVQTRGSHRSYVVE